MKNKWVIDKWENPKISPLMILKVKLLRNSDICYEFSTNDNSNDNQMNGNHEISP
jgi:hypothetical protein